MTEQLLNQPLESAPAETTATTVTPEAKPEETVVSVQQDLILGKFKTAEDLATAYTNLESMLGKKVTNLTPDEANILKQLQGRPKDISEYKTVEGMPEDIAAWVKEHAFRLGLSNNDALEIMTDYAARMTAANEQVAKELELAHTQNVEALKKEFGSAFEQRIAMAREAANTIGGEELINILGERGLGSHPVVIKALAKLGQSLREDSVPKSQHGTAFGTSPAEAKVLINQKLIDRDFNEAYFNARHPGHKAAVEEMLRLHELSSQG